MAWPTQRCAVITKRSSASAALAISTPTLRASSCSRFRIVVQPIDYSKAIAATKSEPPADATGGDEFALAHKLAGAFGPGNPFGAQIEAAAAAYGKQGEQNGVEVSFNG